MYTVEIEDDAGCIATATFNVDNDGGISSAVQNVTDVTCNGSVDGSISLDVLNASNNLDFDWDPMVASGQNPVGLPAGAYSVTITDMDSGCTDEISGIVVGEPDPITYTEAVDNVTCNGDDDGIITITPMGGNGGFSFIWPAPITSTTNVATDLAPGAYIVTISDSNGLSLIHI